DASPYQPNFVSVAQGRSRLAAAAVTGGVYHSSDGLHWTLSRTGNVTSLTAFEDGFVGVGERGMILVSPDGLTWSVKNSGTAKLLTSVAASSTGLVAVGLDGVILHSSNGDSWNRGRTLVPQSIPG